MISPIFIRLILAMLLLAGLSGPAPAELYSWRDSEGVLHATDRPENVPDNVKVDVWPDPPRPLSPKAPPAAPEPPPPEPSLPKTALPAAAVEENGVTQGAFAVHLAQELGLGEEVTPEEAADLLTQIRVTPRLGRWNLAAPVTPEWVARLRTLTVSAAQRGAVQITPEEALLAFDATAALLNVSIPTASDPDLSSRSASSTFLAAPPLVLISPPPPQIVSFYTWVPVEEGFFWSGSRRHGFYVLHEVHLDLHFNGHRFAFRRHHIERRFTDRFFNDPFFDRRVFDVFPPFHDHRPPVIVLPPPLVHQPHLPPPPRRHDRSLRGGSRSTGRPTIRSMPPSAMTPLAPPVGGTALTPLAPRLPEEPPSASVPRRSLRGR